MIDRVARPCSSDSQKEKSRNHNGRKARRMCDVGFLHDFDANPIEEKGKSVEVVDMEYD